MLCPACGAENLPGADECDACRSSLTQEDVPQPTTKIERSLMHDPLSSLEPRPGLSVTWRATLAEAVKLMQAKHIGCVLVTGEGGGLAGILTERDLLMKVAGQGVDLATARVSDYMTPDPQTLKPSHQIAYALHHMAVGGFRHLPLVYDDGRPAGIISARDIIHYLERHFHETVTKRYKRSERK